MSKLLAIELFAGLHGWGEGFVSEGFDVVGFDIVDMCKEIGQPRPEGCQLVLQDVLTLDGRQFRNATVIVASPPCQAYSYRAMPWKRAKALPPPSNELFDACFRIAREAGVPIVVENVKGAQPWVGRAKWHYGSYYLWGDVPALMPSTKLLKVPGFNFHAYENGLAGGSFQSAGVKVAGLNWSGSDKPGYVARAFNDTAVKLASESGRRTAPGNGVRFTSRDCGMERKGMGVGGTRDGQNYGGPFDPRRFAGGSKARKAASAQIAKIPFPLAQWIARVYHPQNA